MQAKFLKPTIYIGLFIIPFIPFLVSSAFFFPFITTKAFAWRIIVEIIFASWFVLALSDAEYRPKKSYILYTVVAFLAVIGLADLFGVAPLRSFWSSFERMEGFITLLHLGMFFLVITSVFKNAHWKRWWNISLVASFLMVLYCVLQIMGLKTINQGGVRVDGTLGNAIYLAVYMLFHIFIALLFLWREWKNSALRWVYGLLILTQVSILYFTATRGAILGLLGGLLIVALLNIRNKENKLAKKAGISTIVGLIVLIGGFVLIRNSNFVQSSPVLSRFSTLVTEGLQRQGRYYVWPMAIEGWKDRPILGWGQENFSYVFQEYYSPDMYNLEPWFDRAHNIFLDWLVVGGLIGLIAYLTLYVIMLYLLWWRSPSLSYAEKSNITGLIAAYFFHNLFVFDHLISYILFFSLLAYVHNFNEGEVLWRRTITVTQSKVLMGLVVVPLALGIFWVNIKPIITNVSVIEALKAIQVSGDMAAASRDFKKAYASSDLGRSEVVEHMASNSIIILTGSLSLEEKNDFFSFVRNAVAKESEDKAIEADARYQILAGSFLSATGVQDEALAHLNRAKELMPNKQQVYFEIGSAYINNNQPTQALAEFRKAYELAPEFSEAGIIYLIGAIYANDRKVESEMLTKLSEKEITLDDRVLNAYYTNNRIDRVRSLFEARMRLDPTNKDKYQELINGLAN